MSIVPKKRAPRNRTIELTEADRRRLSASLLTEFSVGGPIPTGIACGDGIVWAKKLPSQSIDLLFLDPPYNLAKTFGNAQFKKRSRPDYSTWLDHNLQQFVPLLKRTATIYICGDWHTSHSIYETAAKYFKIRNRITWEREKGRGARSNWKNSSEDVWFCTLSDEYYFNVDAVKQRRPVIAPYRDPERRPKDWQESDSGNFRDTHPSNLWTDISIPFWSMPENTDHPTQKSEKFMAKLILASSRERDFVFDPFAGSGTTCVVANKLNRRFLGVEQQREFALLAARRLELADDDSSIQGYVDNVFWPRNSRLPPFSKGGRGGSSQS